MATYIWDLGFDFNASPDPQNSNLPDLQNNMALMAGDVGIDVGNPQDLFLNDTISFNAFNLTSGASTQGYSIMSCTFIFNQGATNNPSNTPYPFDQSVAIFAGGDNSAALPVTAAIGQNSATIPIPELGQTTYESPSFIFTSSPEFPRWVIIPTHLPLATTGKFSFTILLTVQGPPDSSGNTTTMVFRVDPEMVVSSVGGMDDDDLQGTEGGK